MRKAAEKEEGLRRGWGTQPASVTESQMDSAIADAVASRQAELDKAIAELREDVKRESVPFFSMLVLDMSELRHMRISGSAAAALEAGVHEVTVWRESMDAQAEYNEGKVYRVAGLVTSADRRDVDDGLLGDRTSLRFSNGRSSKWSLVPLPPSCQWAAAALMRRRTMVLDVQQGCSRSSDGVYEQCSGKIRTFVDVAVLVLRVLDEQTQVASVTGRGASSQLSHVFVCDESGGLAVIDVWGGVLSLGVPLKAGMVVCIQDLRYASTVLDGHRDASITYRGFPGPVCRSQSVLLNTRTLIQIFCFRRCFGPTRLQVV